MKQIIEYETPVTANSKSLIDVALVTEDFKVTEPDVVNLQSISDHF